MVKVLVRYLILINNIMWVASFYHYVDDYIPINDLPIQDSRLVRADVTDHKASNITTENPFAGRNKESDFAWLGDALRDIAYYLRSHKFNEYDQRYEKNISATREYYLYFPRPPLRSLHWEVHRYCEPSFLSCVEFLRKRIKETGLKRADDTAIVMQEQQWTKEKNRRMIDVVEKECKKMRERDNILANPFQGPLERYQWRTTASYYMCWYTMNEVSDLSRLYETCDNFANCLDPTMGASNQDYRAKDDKPFFCSLYSFCPDPCCKKRHLQKADLCWDIPENPCYAGNPPGKRACTFNRTANTLFTDIVLNRWNVSCQCSHVGYEYDSRYSICVDIDECTRRTHSCDKTKGQACLNQPGSYKCVCKWGFSWNEATNTCVGSDAISLIKLNKNTAQNETKTKTKRISIFKRLFIYIRNAITTKMKGKEV